MKKVTVGVVLFGTKYLEQSIPSLVNQDYPDVEFIFRDQEEGIWSAYDFIKEKFPEIAVTKEANSWHSGGHNAIINQMKGDYYLCCSNDMLYPQNFVSEMVKAMENNPDYGFGTCKIRRWDYSNNQKTTQLDSCGIGITQYHHFYDIGHGEEDKGQYDQQKTLFGASGACCIFTKQALESIRYENEYFDSLMHYKNDVDLSYRLQWAGQKCLFIPQIIVHHDRQANKASIKSTFVKQSSFLGEKILMKKNFSTDFPLKIKLKTHLYHFLKTTFLLLINPQLWKEFRKSYTIKPIQRKTPPSEVVKLMT